MNVHHWLLCLSVQCPVGGIVWEGSGSMTFGGSMSLRWVLRLKDSHGFQLFSLFLLVVHDVRALTSWLSSHA